MFGVCVLRAQSRREGSKGDLSPCGEIKGTFHSRDHSMDDGKYPRQKSCGKVFPAVGVARVKVKSTERIITRVWGRIRCSVFLPQKPPERPL